MDFINALDASTLLTVQTTVAFLTAPFSSPVYNFPLLLFGLTAIDKTDSYEHLRMFTGFLGFSFLFDIIWMFKEEQNGLVQAVTILNTLLKVPTFLSLLMSLRQRGDRFGSALGGERGEFGGGATVWQMPGSLGAQGSYQSLGGDRGDVENPLSKPQPPTPTPAPPAPTIPRAPVTSTSNHDPTQPL